MGLQRARPRVRGGLIAPATLLWSLGVVGCRGGEPSPVAPLADTGDPASSGGSTSSGRSFASGETSTGIPTSSGTDDETTGAPTYGTSGADTPTPLAPIEDGELRPGGETTVDEIGIGAFAQRAANLSILDASDFEAGVQFVQLEWEPAPGQAEADGLGPTYNAVACVGCHVRNGRGLHATEELPDSPGVLVRLGDGAGTPDPAYGLQLQPLAVAGVQAEARTPWSETAYRRVELSGGSIVDLVRAEYSIEALAFGPLGPDTRVSVRIAQQLVGMGLLEALGARSVLAAADPDDLDGDGVSGRPAWLADGSLGRFGWKAAQSSVQAQTAAAFSGDLGITSDSHPGENCPAPQVACAATPSGGSPEITPVRLRVSAAYVRLLGVPARRDGDSDVVRQGKTIFHELGCAACHRPSFTTGIVDDAVLSGQLVWPYTDLLLHDMGDELADELPEGAAAGREWRTPPLWGLGLVEAVNGARYLLHDGRARTLAEAIVWHGGEAAASRDAYVAASDDERAQLHAFVESL